MQQVSKDPLHGKTLEYIVTELVKYDYSVNPRMNGRA